MSPAINCWKFLDPETSLKSSVQPDAPWRGGQVGVTMRLWMNSGIITAQAAGQASETEYYQKVEMKRIHYGKGRVEDRKNEAVSEEKGMVLNNLLIAGQL